MNTITSILVATVVAIQIGTTDSRFPVQNQNTFNSITLETQMKMQYTHPCPPKWLSDTNQDVKNFAIQKKCASEYDFSQADVRVKWAKENNYSVWGHTLVWAMQHSAWLNIPQSPAVKERVLMGHIDTVVTHFCKDVYGWDVINEFWDTGLGIWGDIPDVVLKSFIQTQKSISECGGNALLFFNNGADCYENKEGALVVVDYVNKLKARGAKIDGVASQCHYSVKPNKKPNKNLMLDVQRVYSDNGLMTRFSEADFQISSGATEADQAEAVVSVVSACREAKSCIGVTFWGQDDGTSWINWLGVGKVNALLYDNTLKPKLALSKMSEYLKTNVVPTPTIVPTSSPLPTATPSPTSTPTPQYTVSLPSVFFNAKNQWVDFFPITGSTSVKNYDIVNSGVTGHVERVSRVGDFAGARIIEYSINGRVFEAERWTLAKNNALVFHNYGSPDLRQDRNKFSKKELIPVGTGALYPSLGKGASHAQEIAYGSDGKPEYTTLIQMYSDVEYMRRVVRPISSAEKMLNECFSVAIQCSHVTQIYHFSDHVGAEDTIYISGMPYDGSPVGSDGFSKYYRNGELAWSKYRVLGTPDKFPHPTASNYIQFMRDVARVKAFTTEYYIYDGKYSIDGVNYYDPLAD